MVVLGMIANVPAAGHTWLHLDWLRGIQMLGHEVWYVEDELSWPYDPVQGTRTDDYAYTLAYIRSCLERINLDDHWAFRVAERRGNSWGLSDDELDDLYASCDVLINLEGSTELRDVHMAAPLRVLVETTPPATSSRSRTETRTLAGRMRLITSGSRMAKTTVRRIAKSRSTD